MEKYRETGNGCCIWLDIRNGCRTEWNTAVTQKAVEIKDKSKIELPTIT